MHTDSSGLRRRTAPLPAPILAAARYEGSVRSAAAIRTRRAGRGAGPAGLAWRHGDGCEGPFAVDFRRMIGIERVRAAATGSRGRLGQWLARGASSAMSPSEAVAKSWPDRRQWWQKPMVTKLLIIDPQNDFCDIESAALPVPGASADLARLAGLVARSGDALTEIILTLDSHPPVSIERVTFWRQADGRPVAPFTEITCAAVRAGSYLPRDSGVLAEVVAYLQRLESLGRYRLMVWPVHCVQGTLGHDIYAPLARVIGDWEARTQRSAAKVLKGMHPLTEHYSAIRAEVPREDDPLTGTNDALIDRLRPGLTDRLLVAGEASSHCVRATVLDLFAAFTVSERSRTALLTDCMSPVPGFEPDAAAFLETASAAGATLATSATVLDPDTQAQ